MKRVITGLFDSRSEAEAVVEHLVRHDNLDRSRIRIHGVESGDGTYDTTATEDRGFWASLKDLFISDDDRYAYSEGIRRGGFVVSAELEEAQIEHAMDVFEQHGAVDLDARETEWRSAGWTGNGNEAATVAAGTALPVSTPPMDPSTTAPMPAMDARPVARDRVEGEEVIPIVEETLTVGKREVERGRVRVRSYVVETPVNESVTLRDERVTVERRPVNLPLSAADDAFRERTIEAVEHDEEAVVSKEARVREELVIKKDVGERTETVSDKVRRTEVEVEDDRTAGARASGTTVTGTSTTAKPRS